MIENTAGMTPELARKVTGFATALGALKAKQELGQGATLTADEVNGIIWGIQQLRGASRDAAAAERDSAATSGR